MFPSIVLDGLELVPIKFALAVLVIALKSTNYLGVSFDVVLNRYNQAWP